MPRKFVLIVLWLVILITYHSIGGSDRCKKNTNTNNNNNNPYR